MPVPAGGIASPEHRWYLASLCSSGGVDQAVAELGFSGYYVAADGSSYYAAFGVGCAAASWAEANPGRPLSEAPALQWLPGNLQLRRASAAARFDVGVALKQLISGMSPTALQGCKAALRPRYSTAADPLRTHLQRRGEHNVWAGGWRWALLGPACRIGGAGG